MTNLVQCEEAKNCGVTDCQCREPHKYSVTTCKNTRCADHNLDASNCVAVPEEEETK